MQSNKTEREELEAIVQPYTKKIWRVTAAAINGDFHDEPNPNGKDMITAIMEWATAREHRKTLQAQEELLFDLDEIDNKPWRVFRQLAAIMPEYADIYKRYEDFYAHGGGREVMGLIEKHEAELQSQLPKKERTE